MKKLTQSRLLLLSLCLFSLIGCKSNGGGSHTFNNSLFVDHHFVKPQNLPSPDNVFSLTPQQQSWLNDTVRVSKRKSATQQVINKILKRDFSSFDYDNSYTRTAAQTLEMGQGNCLSMVIMTAAIAKHLDIPFKVQNIKTAPMWDRDGGLYLLNGHVNIQLKNDPSPTSATTFEFFSSPYITLDFINSETRRHLSKRVISQRELIAMYYVNLAADAMVLQQWSNAYWLLRHSLDSAPGYSAAWNSLGVLYKRNNLMELAEKAYKRAMVLDESNMNVVSNYALLLKEQGRFQELFDYQRKVDLAQLKNPYRYFDRAGYAFAQKDYSQALTLYKKAVKLSPVVDAFYFGLFRTYLAMGNKSKARESLEIAHQHSADFEDRKRYSVKLALLNGKKN